MLATARAPMPKQGREGGPKGQAQQAASCSVINTQLQDEEQEARGDEEKEKKVEMGLQITPPKEKKSLDSGKNENEDEHRKSSKVWKGLLILATPTGWHRQPKGHPTGP